MIKKIIEILPHYRLNGKSSRWSEHFACSGARYLIWMMGTALLLSGCVNSAQPSLYNGSSSEYTSEDDPMLKRAVVKLIREYKRLDKKVQSHEAQLRGMGRSSRSIEKFVTQEPKSDASVEVGVPMVNVRSTPSTHGKVYGVASRGETFSVLDKTDTNWYKIKHKKKSAWIHGSAIKK